MNDSCFATLDGQILVIGNTLIERRWEVADCRLFATSFLNRQTGREWCAGRAKIGSFIPPSAPVGSSAVPSLESHYGVHGPTEPPSLRAVLRIGSTAWEFRLFPAGRGVTVRLLEGLGSITATASSDSAVNNTGIEVDAPTAAAQVPVADTLDALVINPVHHTFTQVVLKDQTDVHDNLVFETSYLLMTAEIVIDLSGNLFILEDRFSGEGLLFLKHAPLPHARPIKSAVDVRLRSEQLTFMGHGTGYSSTLLAYSGGRAGRTAAVHDLQRQYRPYQKGRDGLLLSNTWGDRNRDGRLSEAFILQEIEAASKLGVDVVQIDDGWQRGVTANSIEKGGVWESFWESNPDFWQPHLTRFPNGLSPVLSAAKSRGMKFGLWFGPDSGDDFAHWQKDADTLLDFYRRDGVTHIKVDGIKARTATGEANLRKFFEAVLAGSSGQVTFDLDVTAEVRPGYFGAMNVGPLFVENRYTDWHRYWPHNTLRNLWQLAQYVDPARLRMEFLNHTRNPDKYPNDPLAPARYPADYLFASVMFASPLGWFEVSNLPADYVAKVAPLVATWKQHRDAIHHNHTLPIGAAPDGTQWTGFLNLDPAGRSGYALIFRELNDSPTWSLDVPPTISQVTVLAGAGTATLAAGRLNVELPQPLCYLWVRLS